MRAARAGCPKGNIQQTLDALTEARLSVAVFEEMAAWCEPKPLYCRGCGVLTLLAVRGERHRWVPKAQKDGRGGR